jgi:hypothetical protein
LRSYTSGELSNIEGDVSVGSRGYRLGSPLFPAELLRDARPIQEGLHFFQGKDCGTFKYVLTILGSHDHDPRWDLARLKVYRH